MNSPDFKDTVCRICLDENVILDWHSTLLEYRNISYKDCYYKYTQLKPLDVDPFPSMLCQSCLDGLANAHELFIKAVDSYNFLLEVNCKTSQVDDSMIIEDAESYSTDFETVLVEKLDSKSVIVEEYEYDSLDHTSIKAEEIQFLDITKVGECDTEQLSVISAEYNISKPMNSFYAKSKSKNGPKANDTHSEDDNSQQIKTSYKSRHRKVLRKGLENQLKDTLKVIGTKKRKVKSKQELTPCMCSFCSKILHSKYSLQKHEKIHNANRERKAPCPICGVKFLEESYVKTHMQIHNENRVKKHKCEFCDKAFFEKGSLNVHRRIHLGKMIPCPLCSKEFFRQVDLEIHMTSHSATLINVQSKKRSRYWVRCKYCNKNIMSTSFKSHNAVHLNEPLMKCSICNKEFFRRDSCTEHLKTIHDKTSEEYNDFIILYKKNRLSHLYLQQTAELQVNED